MTKLRRVIGVAAAAMLLLGATSMPAKRKSLPDPRQPRAEPIRVSLDQADPYSRLHATAQMDTTYLGSWTFDSGGGCTTEGWTSVDITEQLGDFWHVEDFVGMGAGFQGRVGVIDGTKSLWCGARETADTPLCGYTDLPGYGNNWNQAFCSKVCVSATGALVAFRADWDSEPGYDATTLEITDCPGGVSDEDWTVIAGGIDVWDDNLDDLTASPDSFIVVYVPDSLHTGTFRVRLRFVSDGAWSDEDGLWDTDGAIVIDDLSLTGLPTEQFEDESVGDIDADDWETCTPLGYGDFAGLFSGTGVLQENAGGCSPLNLTCLWGFFAGSTATYACGGHPEQVVVPYGNLRGQYINNEVWSPWTPVTGTGAHFELVYEMYEDLPQDALIYATWHVRSMVEGCPGQWGDHYWPIFPPLSGEWRWKRWGFGDLVEAGATHIQVALGVVDMCPYWCGVVGTGQCHTHAPLYDNVEVYRIDTAGPMWSVRDIDLFQDTFAEDGTTTGTARIDAAIDILPSSNPNYRPGDSTTVRVADPEYLLASDAYTGFGPAVYAYVSAWGPGSAHAGDKYTTDTFRWPVVDSLVHDGRKWYCIRMDTSFTDGSMRSSPQPDAFCIDLNDSLFVPGDTICFVFAAEGQRPAGNVASYWTPNTGTTEDLWEALSNPAECTILPAAGWKRGGDILYVDGFNMRGAQPFFEWAFGSMALNGEVDRYDIRGPSSTVANRPGARVVDVLQQLIPCYRKIIWNTGDLTTGLIGDGTTDVDKSDDAAMLLTFLNNLPEPGGIYFSGDNIAEEWQYLAGSAIPLRETYISHSLVNGDHISAGYAVSPLLVGETGGCFDHLATGPDTMYADGGCPLLNEFDVLMPVGAATTEMRYAGGPPGTNGAVIGQHTENPESVTVGVILSGFSFHYVRDDRPSGLGMDRYHHLHDILVWLANTPPLPHLATNTFANNLAQNYPNPFNPTTTIEFSLRERARVALRIYNVRGQLVRTLVDEVRLPGVAHAVTWDGKNTAGQRVASGVYFYQLVSKNFKRTRKMVLLK